MKTSLIALIFSVLTILLASCSQQNKTMKRAKTLDGIATTVDMVTKECYLMYQPGDTIWMSTLTGKICHSCVYPKDYNSSLFTLVIITE